MSTKTATATATYKGREYRVLWAGTTKTGAQRTHLQFTDGSRDFWVDSAKVSASNSGRIGRGRCQFCGGALTALDMRAGSLPGIAHVDCA